MKEHSLHSSNCPRLNFLMKFSVLSKMQNVTEQISKSAGKLFLFASSPFCFTFAQWPAFKWVHRGGFRALTRSSNEKGFVRTKSPLFQFFTGTGRTRTQSQDHPTEAPQWRGGVLGCRHRPRWRRREGPRLRAGPRSPPRGEGPRACQAHWSYSP